MTTIPRLALVAMLTFGSSIRASASAPEPVPKAVPQSVKVDLTRLGIELDLFAAEARRTRIATTVTGIGIGSALIPTGIILLQRTDGVSQAVVIGMIVGGSAQLLSVLAGFIPTPMGEIRKKLKARVAAHADMQDTVEEIEIGWGKAAADGRSRRIHVGATLLSVGLMSLGAGLTFLIASEGIFGMSRKTQYTFGGILMGTGIPVTTLGARFLLEWSPEETAWEAYRTMKAYGAAQGPPRTPSVSVVPTPGGALAFATLAF